MLVQLDLFYEKTEIDILNERMIALEKTNDKLRKSLYARHGALSKQYLELNNRFEVLERVLCKGKFNVLN